MSGPDEWIVHLSVLVDYPLACAQRVETLNLDYLLRCFCLYFDTIRFYDSHGHKAIRHKTQGIKANTAPTGPGTTLDPRSHEVPSGSCHVLCYICTCNIIGLWAISL